MFFPRFLCPLFCAFCAVSAAWAATPAATPAAAVPREKAADPVLRLTLRKAIQLAIENNLAIKVGAFDPDIADARITAELGTFDPSLNFSASHSSVTSSGDEVQGGGASTWIGGTSIYGTEYNIGLTGTASRYSRYTSGAQFGLTQPLLRGFGSDVNLAALRVARNNRQISEWEFKQGIIDVVTQTVFVYNELYSALRNYDAARHSRDLALELCKEEEARAEIGVKIELDVITAQAEAASREEAVILAKNNIENNERFLKQLVTSQTKTLLETRVAIDPPPTAVIGPMDVQAGLREALGNRPDYQEALVVLKNRHIGIVTARNDTLPRLDLIGSLNLLGLDSHDIADSLRFFGGDTRNPQSWGIGALFSMPLGNRTAKGKLKAARLLDAQALVVLKQLEQTLIVDVANAAGEVETSRQRIDSTQEALRLAKESLSAGQKRHAAGSATTFEVLQLQRSMTEAQAALIRAEADYRKALSEYDRQTGVTLQRNAINVTP
ncbi:MAG: TolC family protein [Chthoniobacteraceae bacterium]|nr:TolC family protein [Chthoniobacteraceae bacterium]